MSGAAQTHPLVGRRLPDGVLRIHRYEDWLTRDAIGAPTKGDRPHPAWALLGTFRGMGADLVELFGVMDAAEDDGVLFGEAGIEQTSHLEYERDYVVTSVIEDVRRRRGSKIPVFDLVDCVVTLLDDGAPVVRCTNTFVVPRRGES
ncbi:hypothetical protein [Nocardioides sp. LHG3406-4]|uniref:hypothetical protein n=1 Tax=Nocardioides sp. LHG3406-4 TaxID=2804575 RepID=UPI003CE718A0